MSSTEPRFVVDPTRVMISGDRQQEAVGLSLRIGEGGIDLHVRTGAVTDRTIELDYADVDEVDVEEELAYSLVLRSRGTSYKVSNVTASDDEIEAMVGYIRTRMRRAQRGSTGGGSIASDGDGSVTSTAGSAGDTAATAGQDDAETGSGGSGAEELKRWVELHEEGIISDEEFEQKKRELL